MRSTSTFLMAAVLVAATAVPAHAAGTLQQKLPDEMVRAWTRFAQTGNPGWSRHDVKVFASEPVPRLDHRCELWR